MKKWIISFVIISILLTNIFTFKKNVNADVYMSGMAVMEVSSKRVLNNFNERKKLPMASTTKILTAITVIDNVEDLNKKLLIPKQAVGIEGSSIYLEANEELSVMDLLYGLMLQSGNDCAVALAIHVSGSVPKFAQLMNSVASRIGAKDSNFVNPHGLHHKDHYTTAYDLALISAYAMQNKIFSKIVGTKLYKTTWQGRNYPRMIKNKNKILTIYEGGNGIKTGFTKAAGRCLVSSATRNGMTIIAVVLNCGPMFEECSKLMDDAFNTYSIYKIVEKQSFIGECKVEYSTIETIKTSTHNDFSYPLREDEVKKIRHVIDFDALKAPIKKNQIVGEIKIYLGDKVIFFDKIYSIEGAASIRFKDKFRNLVDNWRIN